MKKGKLRIWFAGLALLVGFTAFAISSPANPFPVSAGDEVSSVAEVETGEVDNEEGKEGIVDKGTDWIENKVIPLFGGVSIATIIGIAISIVTALTKHKGDKSNRATILGQNEKIEQLKGLVEELKKSYGQVYELSMNAQVAMEQVSQYAKTITEQVAAQNVEIEKVEKMKESIDNTIVIIAKALSISDVAVKSGIAQDAVKLVENLKGVTSDGEEG